MNLELYFLVSAGALLLIAVLLIREDLRHRQDQDTFRAEVASFNSDSLAGELSVRIFRAEDSEFVARETSPSVARAFRQERTVLAIEWLRGVRGQASRLFRSHLKTARLNPDLSPVGELRLGFQFLAFQLTTSILYAVIRIRGPVRAARLVLFSLDLYEKLLKMAKDLSPITGTAVSAEFLELSPRAGNRSAVR